MKGLLRELLRPTFLRGFRRTTVALTLWCAFCVGVAWATSWTTPPTFTFGQLVTETQLNTFLRDNTNYLHEQFDAATTLVCVDSTTVNNATTVETDLAVCSVPAANATSSPPVGLYADGQALRFEAVGTFANTAATKTWRIYVGTGAGGKTITLDASVTAGVDPWLLTVTVRRVTSASQKISARLTKQLGGGTDKLFYDTATVDLTAAWTLKLTGQSSANSNDITKQDYAVWRQ